MLFCNLLMERPSYMLPFKLPFSRLPGLFGGPQKMVFKICGLLEWSFYSFHANPDAQQTASVLKANREYII